MPNKSHTEYRPDIDGLRAIAVLAVVGFHSFPGRFPGGYVGVDVFFVISGFLISSVILNGLQKGNFSFTAFYARRVRRIFPALLLVLAACLAFGWLALLPDEYELLGKHTIANTAFIGNIVLWLEAGYFDSASDRKPLLHLWSLGIEEQFYAIWPVLLVLLWKRWWGLFGIGLLALASFSLNVIFGRTHPDATFYLPVTRLWELLLGCLLACAYGTGSIASAMASRGQLNDAFLTPPPQWIRDGLGAVGLALVLGAVVVVDTSKAFSGWWAMLPTLGAVAIIASGPASWINRKLLAHRALVFVGLISYPLYLWHWPILSYIRIVDPDIANPNAFRAIKLAAIAVSLLLSWLTYKLVETRIRFSPSAGVSRKLIFAGGVLLGLGAAVVSADGFLSRTKLLNDPFVLKENHLRSQSCQRYFGVKLPKDAYCLLSAGAGPASRVDLLLGDSHANGLFWALERASARSGRAAAQLGGPGCFPAAGVQTLADQAGEKDRCTDSNSMSLQVAMQDSRVERVFLAAQWAYYLAGEPVENAPGGHLRLRIAGAGENREVFRKGLNSTLDMLRKAGKDIYFVHQIPELAFSPKDCLQLRPIDALKPIRNFCGISMSDVEARQASYRDVVHQTLMERPLVRNIDPLRLLCDRAGCEAMKDGVLLYRNHDHLTVQAGPMLEPLFDLPPEPPAR